MAIANLNTIKNWFRTGLKPTQDQFWDTWDSFRHKSDKVLAADIDGIDALLSQKADKSIVDYHLTDENAHAALFAKVRIIPTGQLIIFKRTPNENNAILESGDFVMGIIESVFINATYLEGDIALLESFNIINRTDF